MTTPTGRVLSLVEKGWAGARQLSIRFSREGLQVRHLVRGRLAADVRACLTPYAGITIWGIPRRVYRVVVWLQLFAAPLRGPVRAILIDNERSARWINRWFPHLQEYVILIQERGDGSPVIKWRGAKVNVDAAAGMAMDIG